MNQICVTTRPSRCGKKTWYYFEWGKAADQRLAAGIFTYSPAKDQTQRNHNKEAEAILERKKSQMTVDFQSIGTGYIPNHRFKHNFLDFYKDFVDNNARKGNRHLEGSLSKFKTFVPKPLGPGSKTGSIHQSVVKSYSWIGMIFLIYMLPPIWKSQMEKIRKRYLTRAMMFHPNYA